MKYNTCTWKRNIQNTHEKYKNTSEQTTITGIGVMGRSHMNPLNTVTVLTKNKCAVSKSVISAHLNQ